MTDTLTYKRQRQTDRRRLIVIIRKRKIEEGRKGQKWDTVDDLITHDKTQAGRQPRKMTLEDKKRRDRKKRRRNWGRRGGKRRRRKCERPRANKSI